MKTNLMMLIKSLALVLVAVVVFTIGEGVAHADEVTLTGSTTGTLSGPPSLTFAGTSFFTGTTALGFGSLSGSNSLGSFFLSTGPLESVSGTFTLNVTFTSPTGIDGGQGAIYNAIYFGSVSPNINQGGVTITFAPFGNFQNFPFHDGLTSGRFSLEVANVFVQSGQSASLIAGFTGEQRTTVVPEPATLLLLGAGLTGIAARWRKRTRARA